MDNCTYSLQPDVLQPWTLRLMRTRPDACTSLIPFGWGLTPAQWRAVLATLPAEDGDCDPPVEVAEDSIGAELARVTAERDELRTIVQGYEDARRRLIWRAASAATSARNHAQKIRQCADQAEQHAKYLTLRADNIRVLSMDPQDTATADVSPSAHADKANRIYVAGPLSTGPRMSNIDGAIDAADLLLRAGWSPYVPHLTHWWDLYHPHTHEEWLAHDFVWLAQCNALVRLPGESAGADQEVDMAEQLGIPVYHGVEAVPAPDWDAS